MITEKPDEPPAPPSPAPTRRRYALASLVCAVLSVVSYWLALHRFCVYYDGLVALYGMVAFAVIGGAFVFVAWRPEVARPAEQAVLIASTRTNTLISKALKSVESTRVPSAVIFTVAFLLVASRRAAVLTDPQFYAEDGRDFFAQAHNIGFRSLWMPNAGYVNVAPRLVAFIANLLPLPYAPLVVGACAIGIYAICATFVTSERLSEFIPSRLARYLVALGFIGTTYGPGEILGNMACAQGLLLVLSLMTALAETAKNRFTLAADFVTVLVAGLSTPAAAILVLITALRRKYVLLAGALAGAAAQFAFHGGTRALTIGFRSPELLVRIIAGHCTLGEFFGSGQIAEQEPFVACAWAVALAVGLVIYCLIHNRLTMWLAITAVLVLSAGLIWPIGGEWSQILHYDNATRYFFPFGLLWPTALIPLLWRPKARIIAVIGMAVMSVTCLNYWRLPSYADAGYAAACDAVDNAPRGSVIDIPITPPGWYIVYHKN